MTRNGTILLFFEFLCSILIVMHAAKKRNKYLTRFILALLISFFVIYLMPHPAITATKWYHAYIRELYLVFIMFIFVYFLYDIEFINISYLISLAFLVNEAGQAFFCIFRALNWIPNFHIIGLSSIHSFEIIFMILYYSIFGLLFYNYRLKSKIYNLQYKSLNVIVVVAFLVNDLFKRLPYIMNQYNDICVWIFELLFVVFACISFFMGFKLLALQNENQIIEQISKDSYKQFEITKDTIEAINIKCHDLKHKLYLENISKDEKDEIVNLIDIYDSSIRTGNTSLDYILMDYNLRQRDKGISISFMGDGKSLNFIKESDVFNFVTNALENSIEALSRINDNDSKLININVETIGELIIFVIRNYHDGNIIIENGVIKTKKEYEVGEHGYGIKSMRNIAKKYNGDIKLNTENNIFTLTAYFMNTSK